MLGDGTVGTRLTKLLGRTRWQVREMGMSILGSIGKWGTIARMGIGGWEEGT